MCPGPGGSRLPPPVSLLEPVTTPTVALLISHVLRKVPMSVDNLPARPVTLAEERYLQGTKLDPEMMSESIARRILAAETAEDIFGGVEAEIATGSMNLEDLLYEPLIFHSIEGYAKSTKTPETGNPDHVRAFGFYTVSRAKPAPGGKAPKCDWVSGSEPFVVSCGATNVVAALDRGAEKGLLPLALVIVESEEPTASGYRPYWARMIDHAHPLPAKPARLQGPKVPAVDTSDEEPF